MGITKVRPSRKTEIHKCSLTITGICLSLCNEIESIWNHSLMHNLPLLIHILSLLQVLWLVYLWIILTLPWRELLEYFEPNFLGNFPSELWLCVLKKDLKLLIEIFVN